MFNYIGKRQYELSNHLGNVLTVVSDRKFARDIDQNGEVDYFEPDILLTYDYSPFGVILKERSFEKDVCQDVLYSDTTVVIDDDFNDGTVQGWVVLGGSLIYNSNNTLAIEKDNGNTLGATKQFAASQGVHYYFSAYVNKGNCNVNAAIEIEVRDPSNVVLYTTTLPSGSGTFTYDFIAPTSGNYTISFERINNASNCIFYVDDVLVYGVQDITICECAKYGGFRYGYNKGSEKDDEIKGAGNSYTTYFRQLDTRLGRWLSIDPVKQAWQSPYSSMDNNPIGLNDPLGNYVPTEVTKKAKRKENIDIYGVPEKVQKSYNQEYGIKVKMVDGNLMYAGEYIERVEKVTTLGGDIKQKKFMSLK
ncbi:MAG: hypothetical protein ACK4K0_03645 [Flavobacteriales bacterium]